MPSVILFFELILQVFLETLHLEDLQPMQLNMQLAGCCLGSARVSLASLQQL